MSATGQQQDALGSRAGRRGLIGKVDRARFSQNDFLQIQVIAQVQLFMRDPKLIRKVQVVQFSLLTTI